MKRKINRKKLEDGMRELMEIKIGNVEEMIVCADKGQIEVAVQEFRSTYDLARGCGIGETDTYLNRLLKIAPALKNRYGIEIK